MLREGNIMMYMEDWFEVTEVPFSGEMDDRRCGERINHCKTYINTYRVEREFVRVEF